MHKNACAQKKSHCRGTGSEAVEKPRGKRERAEALLRFARLFCQSFRHGLRRVTSRSLRRGLRRATVPQFNMVASLRAQSALAMVPVSLGLLRPVSATGGGLRAPLFPSGKRRLLDSATSYGCTTNQKAPLSKRGARRPPPVAETGRSKPSEARSIASELCERSEATMLN